MLSKTFFILVMLLIAATSVFTQVPQLINYQGLLTDASDNPITGSYTIQFKIYNQASGGSALWTETHQNVTITDGVFSVILGASSTIPYTLFDGTDKYLGITIGSDSEMSPRKQLVSVGYSFRAYDADKVDGQDASYFSPTTHNHDSRYYQQSQLNTNDGTVNQASDPVSWFKIKNMPAGFADGSDDGGGGGDNLGNHTATENIKLNGNYLSNDGGNEGISVDNSGNVTAKGYLQAGSPSAFSKSSGGIYAQTNICADQHLQANMNIYATGSVNCNNAYVDNNLSATNGYIKTGSPSLSYGNGDIVATNCLIADVDVFAGDDVKARKDIVSSEGCIRTYTPSSSYGNGDIVATDDLIADVNVIAGHDVEAGNIITALNVVQTSSNNGVIKTGTPQNYGLGDIASTDDLYADDDLFCGGTKSAYTQTNSYGTRLFYSEEATEVYFFDRGQAQLINGEAIIQLDPIFREAVTIEDNNPIIVQITLTADCNGVFVTNKTQHSFTVKELMNGNSSATFDWEVCAKRRNYETVRMELLEKNN